MIKALLGIAALVPFMTGPVPQDEKSLLIELCSGGQIAIPLGGEEREQDRPCDPQACHAGTCREKPKRPN